MPASRQNMFTRDDTFFGVCEALGEDFRIPSNLLRLVFALAFFWNPVAVTGIYFAIGALVLLTRLIAPGPRPAETAPPPAAAQQAEAAPARRAEQEPVEQLAA